MVQHYQPPSEQGPRVDWSVHAVAEEPKGSVVSGKHGIAKMYFSMLILNPL